MIFAILVLEELEPLSCHLYQVGQITIYLVNLRTYASHQFFCLVLVELQDTLHLDFEQFQDVVLRDLAYHLRIERCQSLVDMLADAVDVRCLFELLVLIDTLLDEDFL